MKLYANLIPALGYALVTMFSNMAGLNVEVGKPSKMSQKISLPVTHKEISCQNSYVLVLKNGQNIQDSFSESLIHSIFILKRNRDLTSFGPMSAQHQKF